MRLYDTHLRAAINEFDYAFAENGLTAYKLGKQLESASFIKYVGEERYKPLVNFILHYIADIDLPIKRSVSQTRHIEGFDVQLSLGALSWNSVTA